MYIMDDYDLLKLSVQSALVGEIPDNLFAVTCGVSHTRISVIAYFEGAVGDEEWHLIRKLSTEVAADFPDGYSVQALCYSMQQTELRMMDFWAFLRASSPRRRAVASKSARPMAVGVG